MTRSSLPEPFWGHTDTRRWHSFSAPMGQDNSKGQSGTVEDVPAVNVILFTATPTDHTTTQGLYMRSRFVMVMR
jgi:hypothetical protein